MVAENICISAITVIIMSVKFFWIDIAVIGIRIIVLTGDVLIWIMRLIRHFLNFLRIATKRKFWGLFRILRKE